MQSLLTQFLRALPAGAAMLVLAACGGAPTPTASTEAPVVAKAPATEAEAATPASVTVRGTVLDSSNRPVANANVECLGDVHCTGTNEELSAEGHEHRAVQTDAHGSYQVVATSQSAGGSGFSMNANGQGYQVEWRQVAWPDPGCTSSQPHCALTVNFTLTSVAQ